MNDAASPADAPPPAADRPARRRLALCCGVSVGAALALALLVFGFLPGWVEGSRNTVVQAPPYTVSDEAAALHAELVVADLHADSLLWGRDLLVRGDRGQVDLPRLREGHVALQVFTCVSKTPAGLNIHENHAETVDQITALAVAQRWPPATWTSLLERVLYQAERLRGMAARSDGGLRLVTTRAELDALLADRAAGSPAVGALLGIEGAHALDGRVESLDALFAAGFRMIGLVHFFDNGVGGSAHGVDKGGLTPLGAAVVARMEQLGIVVDLAHASPALIDDVLDQATRPVVVSHTGVRGVVDNQRNLSDDQLRRIAATGGVVGIGFWKLAIGGDDAAAIARSIRYTADVVGVDHVGLGSDFDGAVETPFDISGLALLTEALLAEGFGPDEVRKLMGGNLVRVLRQGLPE